VRLAMHFSERSSTDKTFGLSTSDSLLSSTASRLPLHPESYLTVGNNAVVARVRDGAFT